MCVCVSVCHSLCMCLRVCLCVCVYMWGCVRVCVSVSACGYVQKTSLDAPEMELQAVMGWALGTKVGASARSACALAAGPTLQSQRCPLCLSPATRLVQAPTLSAGQGAAGRLRANQVTPRVLSLLQADPGWLWLASPALALTALLPDKALVDKEKPTLPQGTWRFKLASRETRPRRSNAEELRCLRVWLGQAFSEGAARVQAHLH